MIVMAEMDLQLAQLGSKWISLSWVSRGQIYFQRPCLNYQMIAKDFSYHLYLFFKVQSYKHPCWLNNLLDLEALLPHPFPLFFPFTIFPLCLSCLSECVSRAWLAGLLFQLIPASTSADHLLPITQLDPPGLHKPWLFTQCSFNCPLYTNHVDVCSSLTAFILLCPCPFHSDPQLFWFLLQQRLRLLSVLVNCFWNISTWLTFSLFSMCRFTIFRFSSLCSEYFNITFC